MVFSLISLMTGAIKPLGKRGVSSGIDKWPVTQPIMLEATGFMGDAQGDTRRHGGPEKAVHHYPLDHHPAWRAEMPHSDLLDRPGAFGENISTMGLTEDTVAVGDVFSLGTAVVEVSQGRQPCWRLNERFADPRIARLMQSTGRTGWYYRVLQTGSVGPDDVMTLQDRRSPEWTIRRVWECFYVDPLNKENLSALSGLSRLSMNWRANAARRLEIGVVEDWTARLGYRFPRQTRGRF